MSSTELLLFVSLLCLWALVRVMRKFLKNSLIFLGHGYPLWCLTHSNHLGMGDHDIIDDILWRDCPRKLLLSIGKRLSCFWDILVLHQIFVLGKIVHDDWKRLNKREFARSRK